MTAALCPSLRQSFFDHLQSGRPVDEVYFDLSQCSYMDSTFMGLLLIFHKALKDNNGHALVVLRPTEECRHLLNNLGVSKIIQIQETEIAFPTDLQLATREKAPTAELLLQAHQNLMELSEENKQRFALVEKTLKDAAEREGG